MRYSELREEVVARGFEDLTAASVRVKRWVNEAYREVTDYMAWPFLEATKEGTAPLTVTDLGHVLSVTNQSTDYRLRYADRRILIDFDPKLNDTGSASNWYREGEAKIAVWPGDTSSTYLVRYLKVPAELKEDADEPMVPTLYQGLIVDGAVVRAFKNRSNFQAAQFVRQEWTRGLEQMTKALMKTAYDRDPLLVRTGTFVDYI